MELYEEVTMYSSDDSDDALDMFSLARHDRQEELDQLLRQGAVEVNSQDRHGNTMLVIACQNGLKSLARLLLRYGADVNMTNNRGNTPLHYCFAYGYEDTLGTYLISKGADITLKNAAGKECHHGISDK
ncbi:hypothetical protein THRCLA_22723 [Thraustotheca clavata]|uniref:Uncharacterized protein n=1 Tax=Thraustotheca clavata TaxID=74557 RepID=A0A1V9YU73_9STRA|nr:hypothetical protein THRCLA_22723 [Thraustotheca clavata]